MAADGEDREARESLGAVVAMVTATHAGDHATASQIAHEVACDPVRATAALGSAVGMIEHVLGLLDGVGGDGDGVVRMFGSLAADW